MTPKRMQAHYYVVHVSVFYSTVSTDSTWMFVMITILLLIITVLLCLTVVGILITIAVIIYILVTEKGLIIAYMVQVYFVVIFDHNLQRSKLHPCSSCHVYHHRIFLRRRANPLGVQLWLSKIKQKIVIWRLFCVFAIFVQCFRGGIHHDTIHC